MSQSGTSAEDLVNTLSQKELSRIIYTYGEEKFADSISKSIVKQREISAIHTTFELAEIIRNSVPERVRRNGHPARKTFQALRIAVNHELEALEKGMDEAFELLAPGGRLAIITFHSLEDRIVKQKMNGWYQGCTCPPDFPVCVCGKKPQASPITRKPIVANQQELERNVRARSAKLRICEKN
jgi:16S rRNA (cytosine1402-N4)-methyltransferase